MKFFLKEGDLYLSWARCKELWDTLVDNPNAIEMDRDMIFNWFETCITDLEADTQMDLFSKKLLSMNAEDTTKQGFDCFKKFFENINLANNNMRKGPSQDRIVCLSRNDI